MKAMKLTDANDAYYKSNSFHATQILIKQIRAILNFYDSNELHGKYAYKAQPLLYILAELAWFLLEITISKLFYKIL